MKEQRRNGDAIGYKILFGLAVGIIGTLFSLVLVMGAGKVTDMDARISKQEITATDIRTAQGAILAEMKSFAAGLDELKGAVKELGKELRDHSARPK